MGDATLADKAGSAHGMPVLSDDTGVAAQTTSALALEPQHMPRDFSISLDALRRGGTDEFLAQAPQNARRHPMAGFEKTYVNIVDYIVRITHRIWEEKDIGYIYDTYSHDCKVWDDFGLQYGRDKIVADTVHTNNAFPDIRLVADEVIWAGDDQVGFHTSHRTKIFGTNTGYSKFGPPTGRSVRLWCIANCIARDNEIFDEWVNYDTGALIQQLGFDVAETARRFAAEMASAKPLSDNFLASEPVRLGGQNKPPVMDLPARPEEDPRAFVEAAFHSIWNRRNFGTIDRIYAPSAIHTGSTDRVYKGPGQIRSFVMSMVAMFPNLSLRVDEIYWMGNPEDGIAASIRWSASGTHTGHGIYGAPTGREVQLRGITQWDLRDGRVQNEWALFNELGVLMQILAP
ncbi:MAG: ester cyclase [Pseudomonadota bacterium]